MAENTTSAPAGPPVSVLSAIATIVLDWVWDIPELAETLSVAGLPLLIVTILATGVSCGVAVTLLQHYTAEDDWGAAVSKGFVMGIVAGVPYAVLGTVVGTVLLGWAGIHHVRTGKAQPEPAAPEAD